MPSGIINGVGNPSSASGWTGGTDAHCIMGIPDGRQAANGLRPVRVKEVGLYASGRGGDRNASIGVGGGSSAVFTLAAGGSAGYAVYGIGQAPAYFPGTQHTTLTISTTGSFYYGRAPIAGVDLYEGGSVAYAGHTLPGYYSYEEVPAAPAMVAAIPGPGGSVVVSFSGSGDTGDAPITGWKLQYADNPQFANAVTVDSNGTTAITKLTPGRTYWFRAAGRNNVADAYGTTGPWSGAIAATMRSGGKVRSGGAWKAALPKVRVGGAWKDALVKVRSGGTWKDAL